MGIFSATHRQLAKEASDCVFRRITFRKCESGLDIRLKSQVNGILMKRSLILSNSELQKTGIYGTPTIFINGKAIIVQSQMGCIRGY